MADDKKRQQNKQVSDAKKNVDVNQKILDKQKAELQRQTNLQEIQNKIQKTSLTAQKLKEVGDVKNSKIIEDSLKGLEELLGKNKNANSVNARLEELISIEDNANSAAKLHTETFRKLSEQNAKKEQELIEQQKVRAESQKASEDAQKALFDASIEAKENLGLKGLTDKLKDDTATLVAQQSLGSRELGKTIKDLGLGSQTTDEKERANALKDAFREAQSNLNVAMESGDPEAIKLARLQVQNLEKAVKSEEEIREQQKKTDAANSTLLTISDGVKGFNDKLGAMAKGGGFVAGLAAVVLAVFNPELLSTVVMKVVDWFSAIVDSIEALVNGDMEKFKTTLSDNFALFAGLLGLGLVYFGPALLSGLFTVMNTMKAVRGFMLVTGLPAISAFFTGMMASVSAMLVPMLPFIAIGAAIVATLGVLLFGFNKLRSSLGPGAGIIDTLKVAALYLVDFLSMLVNGITFLPRKVIGFLGKRAAKWLFGDDVDTSMFDSLSEGLRTDRGSSAAAELKEKNEIAAAEAALEKERQSKIGTGEGFDMGQLGAQNADIMADLQAQGFQLPSAIAQTNVSNNSSNSQSTTIVTERPSRSSTILNSYNSAIFR